MKICLPVNNKTSAKLLYTRQRVRLIPKATCNVKKDNNIKEDNLLSA
jgi:hypothetical protein